MTTQTLFKLKNTSVMPLTRELAERICNMEGSPTERELNPKRLAYLESKIKENGLTPFQWAIATLNGKTYRVNGQHSSDSLCKLNGEFPSGATVVLSEYEVESMEGLVYLFRQFDPKQCMRSTADVAGAYQGIEESLSDVSRRTAKIGIDGIAWYNAKIKGTKQPAGDDKYELMGRAENHAFLHWLNEIISDKTPELKAKPIIAAMFSTFNTNESAARDFWDTVARQTVSDGETASTSEEILDRWLVEIKNKTCKPLKPSVIYQGCLYAWNASREDQEITTIKANLSKGFFEPRH